MHMPPPRTDVDPRSIEQKQPRRTAVGLPAIGVAVQRSVEQMGVTRTVRTLGRLNQADGFDCPGCAWPDPDPDARSVAEFCENGAKAVAEEATRRTVGPAFSAVHSLADLADRSDYWLGQQGRLTHPMVRRAGGSHYEPISWEEAFALAAGHLTDLASPDEAIFYTICIRSGYPSARLPNAAWWDVPVAADL
jgi:anaerobic selenocysteine-containing dehydrogenase